MKCKMFLVICFMFAAICPSFAQNDRNTFDLKGNIRLCVPTVSDYGFVLPSLRAEFSEEGTLISLDGMDMTKENGSYSITRDDNQRIVRLKFSAGDADRINTFAYDATGRITEVKNYFLNIDTDAEELDTRMVRSYDSNGLPVRETYYNQDGSERATFSYTYKDTDAEGNWTKRTVSEPTMGVDNETETRQLSSANAEGQAADANSVNASYDQAQQKASDSTVINQAQGKNVADYAKDILLGLFFILMFSHMIYENYIKKPSFSQLTATGADTDAEIELANRLRTTILDNCTSLAAMGSEDAMPTKRSQLRAIKTMMNEVLAANPRGNEVVRMYNNAVVLVNECEKRSFVGSKQYLILGLIVFGIITVIQFNSNRPFSGLAFSLMSVVAYWLGSRRPAYQIIDKVLNRPNHRNTTTSAILNIFDYMGSGTTYITKYYENGIKVREEKDESDHLWTFGIALVMLFILGLLMVFIGAFNYIRFYLIHRT